MVWLDLDGSKVYIFQQKWQINYMRPCIVCQQNCPVRNINFQNVVLNVKYLTNDKCCNQNNYRLLKLNNLTVLYKKIILILQICFLMSHGPNTVE